MGREGWFDEVISFYDQYLKGIEPTVAYPAYVVQDSAGAWRAQDRWPVVEYSATIALGGGSYLDDGLLVDPAAAASNSFFVWSGPVTQPTRITGAPRVSLEIEGHGNVMVDLYDVAPDGSAVMFDQQVAVVKPGTTSFELRSTDWTLPVGHALAVKIGTIQPGFALANDWIDTPSYETIIVRDARLELALDDPANDTPTPGDPAVWLGGHRSLFTEKLCRSSTSCARGGSWRWAAPKSYARGLAAPTSRSLARAGTPPGWRGCVRFRRWQALRRSRTVWSSRSRIPATRKPRPSSANLLRKARRSKQCGEETPVWKTHSSR